MTFAACSRTPASVDKQDAVRIITGQAIAEHRRSYAPVAVDIAARLPVAAPLPEAPVHMIPHKSFIDPPLPPELRDDGGLIPLPPPPTANQAAAR